jgi:hypothetical protein
MRRSFAILTMVLALLVSCKATKKFFGRLGSSVDPVVGPWEKPRSLESGPDTNGAIACAALAFPDSLRHADTDHAFANLLTAATQTSATTVVLIGHGAPGALCTGNGDDCVQDGTIITFQNEGLWENAASTLSKSKITTLRLLSCGVGYTKFGQTLLQELADHTNCTVYGPVKNVFCRNGNLEVEDGAWAMAKPGGSVVPLRRTTSTTKPSYLRLRHRGRFVDTSWDKLDITFDLLQAYGQKKYSRLSEADAKRLSEMISFGQPFTSSAPSLSLKSGVVAVKLPWLEKPRQFTIYSDLAVRDDANPALFYHTSGTFAEEVAELREKLRPSAVGAAGK